MEICDKAVSHTHCAVGNTIPRALAADFAYAHARFVLCFYSQPWDTHVLYDNVAHFVLVWLRKCGESVSFSTLLGLDMRKWNPLANNTDRMVHVLALGVFWSGFVKDMLCLPRPLSPPLHRITMSGSAALEYGFPSTHSTNAVSVALYAIQVLNETKNPENPLIHTAAQGLFYFYASSIVFGRLYCGMHGFFDVVIGIALGAILAIIELGYGEAVHDWICEGPFYYSPLIFAVTVLFFVRIHPEPADDCPCYDDSVAFSGVIIGIELGSRNFSQLIYADNSVSVGHIPFDFEDAGWAKACLRVVLGIFVIFSWRGIMKPVLLKALPPLFRFLERVRLILPRRFFLQAS